MFFVKHLICLDFCILYVWVWKQVVDRITGWTSRSTMLLYYFDDSLLIPLNMYGHSWWVYLVFIVLFFFFFFFFCSICPLLVTPNVSTWWTQWCLDWPGARWALLRRCGFIYIFEYSHNQRILLMEWDCGLCCCMLDCFTKIQLFQTLSYLISGI